VPEFHNGALLDAQMRLLSKALLTLSF